MGAEIRMKWSVFLVWLFHISAIVGVFLGYRDWFISQSALNLLLCAGLVTLNNTRNQNVVLLIPFLIGMLAEIMGVQTGLLFGSYSYGHMLGWKLFGVPLMIGCNWALLVYATAVIAGSVGGSVLMRALLGASMMVLLDAVMEPVAPRIDYWIFANNHVPLKNYIHWFLVALVAHLFYLRLGGKKDGALGWNLYIVFFIFFMVLLFT